MGANSTIQITRGAAQRFLVQKMMGNLPEATLEILMDEFLRERLYNVRIVDDGDANDDTLLTF